MRGVAGSSQFLELLYNVTAKCCAAKYMFVIAVQITKDSQQLRIIWKLIKLALGISMSMMGLASMYRRRPASMRPVWSLPVE